MPNRKRQLREFLSKHPLCIFCGGIAPATTRDHVPSRQNFHLREWPEGYEFPSCEPCNQSTKDAEQVVALIARIGPGPKAKSEQTEMDRIVRALRNNCPDVLLELRATPSQIGEYRARPWFGELAKTGQAAPVPLSVRGPIVSRSITAVARKLFTALHYREFEKIIPAKGGIFWRWYTNVQRLDNKLPEELLSVINSRPIVKRGHHDLSDQFSYSFAKVEDGELAGYFATFWRSFALLGFVDLDAEQLQHDLPPLDLLRPLSTDASISRQGT